MMRLAVAVVLPAIGLMGCASPDPGDDDTPPKPEATVEIGLPSGVDDLSFTPLEPGGELRLQTFGQGGTHILMGVRCVGFGNRAFVSIAIKNLNTDAVVRTPAPVRPQLLFCHEDAPACDLVPLLAMTSGLTEPDEERDHLPVELSATVKNEAGAEARAAQQAVLSTADL